MSKIGRKPIKFSSANVEVNGKKITVKGPKTSFLHELPAEIDATVSDKELSVSCNEKGKKAIALWGLHRSLLANMVKGVETGFERVVKIVGLGYKAQLSGKKLVFSLGFSHKVEYALPEGVTVDVNKPGQLLTFKSHDKDLLGNVCDKIRDFKPPEPYKGYGIMLADEFVRRKAGKTGAGGA